MSSVAGKFRQLDNWFGSDMKFHRLYPTPIRQLARRHWTPISIAKLAAGFLVPDNGVRVLDIGSGVGKFCLCAAHYKPFASFYGIEQRKELVEHAETAKSILGLDNVTFAHGNFTQLDLSKYDHFYFYNSFFENLDSTDKIDDTIFYSESLYDYYNRYLYKQLEGMPAGTRVATCCSLDDEIPPDYQLINSSDDRFLKFWMKI